jgi:hypothetical protein
MEFMGVCLFVRNMSDYMMSDCFPITHDEELPLGPISALVETGSGSLFVISLGRSIPFEVGIENMI